MIVTPVLIALLIDNYVSTHVVLLIFFFSQDSFCAWILVVDIRVRTFWLCCISMLLFCLHRAHRWTWFLPLLHNHMLARMEETLTNEKQEALLLLCHDM